MTNFDHRTFQEMRPARLNPKPETRNAKRRKLRLRLALRRVESIDEAALVQLAHESRVDQLLNFERRDLGILLRHQTLRVAQTVERWIGFAIQRQQVILITVFRHARIADAEMLHEDFQRDGLIRWLLHEYQTFRQRGDQLFNRNR